MSVVLIALALLGQAAPALDSSAEQQPSAEQQIVMIGRKLQQWRGRFRAREGQFDCSTTRSTGDADIDAIGCAAAKTCYLPHHSRLIATVSQAMPRPVRRTTSAEINRELNACHNSERDRLIDELIERRHSER